MIDGLLCLDRSFSSTWKRYLAVLHDAALAPEQAATFLDRLSAEPDEYLGYNTKYPYSKALWLLRLGRDTEALDAFRKGELYGCRGYPPGELLDALKASPAAAEYMRNLAAESRVINLSAREELLQHLPFTWLERGPVPVKSMWDICRPKAARRSLFKGDDAYFFRSFTQSRAEKWAAAPDLFDRHPYFSAGKEKYANDAYAIHEYNPRLKPFRAPYLNRFLNTRPGDAFDLETLLRKAATERGGGYPYAIGQGGDVLYAEEVPVNYCSNGEIVYLLYILKKCGYLENVFNALPGLPEDFPLLLMCFADRGIRQRVEEYMGLPGLASMFDLAFAPRRLNVKEQLKLIEFGKSNPRFQELLAASLSRYGYHLYNQFMPNPDWYVQDFAHFGKAYCCDVMLFLASAPELQPQVRLMLEYGPGTGFAFGSVVYQGFTDGFVFFYRNILAYLAMTRDSRLAAWRMADLDKKEDAHNAGRHRRVKTADLVTALQKQAK